jgi:glycosyltransferase involved in cell wall biosynthesis
MPTVDVIMPVRNGIQFLGEAVDSIRNQTFSDWRLLILDHGSHDGSIELAHRYADLDRRIKIFSFPDADGLAELRNLGLDKCDCEYLLLQDADDISLPNRMAVINDLFHDRPEFWVLGGQGFHIDEAGRQIGYGRHSHVPTSSKAITAACFFYNAMGHSTLSINFAAFKRCGARYGKDILNQLPAEQSPAVKAHLEDYFLFGQLALLGVCASVEAPLIKYRMRSGSMSTVNPAQQIDTALQISHFLAKSFCMMKCVPTFDPGPFCNHAEYVFDFQLRDYSAEFEQMAATLRRSLGQSAELERELAFRRILATRNSALMATRYLQFHLRYAATPRERRTVRNWLLRAVRKGKYVYRTEARAATAGG